MKFGVFFFLISAIHFTANASNFKDWEGTWRGRCQAENYRVAEPIPPHEMVLTIGEEDSHGELDWHIQYSGQPKRQYAMKAQEQKGHYLLDEKNGLLIDRYLIGNKLRDLFSLSNGAILVSETERIENEITIRNFFFNSKNARTTELNSNPSFRAHSYPFTNGTFCQLKRIR